MFYASDFKIGITKDDIDTVPNKNESNYIISLNKKKLKNNLQNSLVFAAKPLILFVCMFGSQLVRYKKNDIVKSTWDYKLYSTIVTVGYLSLTLVIRPASWHYTRSDHPLNILTIAGGMINILEVTYLIFVTSCCNTGNFVILFKKLDDIDGHFKCTKLFFQRRRCISILFVLTPIIELHNTLLLIKFDIQNIGAMVTFFLLTLQGAVVCFAIANIYLKHLSLNRLLNNRVKLTISDHKNILFRETFVNKIINIICKEPKLIQNKDLKYSWFELMQIYDKLADCVNLFNKVYCVPVFLMFITWLIGTLLLICRSLSPSIKYSKQLFLSDMNLYLFVNSRPIFLAFMCDMFIKERKRTLSLLFHILLKPGKDHAYFNQVETMIMLVKSRKLEISANVFTVNVASVMTFAGRVISYTVLVIQYFYNYVFFT